MAKFDEYLTSIGKEPNSYEGDPPSTEAEYNALTWPEGVTAPTWAEVQAGIAAQAVKDTRHLAYMGGETNYGYHIQLEKLWDDIHAGHFGEPAKTGEFYTFINTIKTSNPMPE